MSSIESEKDFLSNVEYIYELSDKVKDTKKIDRNLLSEIVCAKSYIDSLLSQTSVSDIHMKHLSDISCAFDIIIADSKSINKNKFRNPNYESLTLRDRIYDYLFGMGSISECYSLLVCAIIIIPALICALFVLLRIIL